MTINFTGLVTTSGQIKVGTPPPAVLPPDWNGTLSQQTLSGTPLTTQELMFSGDGSTFVRTQPRDGSVVSDGGSVQIYTKPSTTWTLEETLSLGSPAIDDFFGDSATISDDGNSLAIGAKGRSGGAGRVYFYTRSGSTWTLQQTITGTGLSANDNFGDGLAISGDGQHMLISAPGDDNSPTFDSGRVYYFTRSGNTWTEINNFISPSIVTPGRLGAKIQMNVDGTRATLQEYVQTSSGKIRTVERTGSTWSFTQDFTVAGGFGRDFDMSPDGDTVIAGAPYDDSQSTDAGLAYRLTHNGTSWANSGSFTYPSPTLNYNFGHATGVSNLGEYAVVTNLGGGMYVYKLDGGSMVLERTISIDSSLGQSENTFLGGRFAAMSPDGKTVAVTRNDRTVIMYTAPDAT